MVNDEEKKARDARWEERVARPSREIQRELRRQQIGNYIAIVGNLAILVYVVWGHC